MSRNEAKKYFDSLLIWVHNEYNRKNKYFENLVKEKITDEQFKIPTINEYNDFLKRNYCLPQLKKICENFGLKISGNKDILIARIFSYLYLSTHIIKIQKIVRKMIVKKYLLTHGPAYKNRTICINTMDFCTMDDVKDIVPSQFFSYKDDDNFIYGFDIISFHNLIQKTETPIITNPFTKKQIPSKIIMQFKELKKLSTLLKIPINLRMDSSDEPLILRSSKEKADDLFRYIDQLGNYTNPEWFMELSKDKLLELVMELFELWYFRAELNHATRIKICHPNGNPFVNEHLEGNQTILNYLRQLPNLELLRSSVLDILEKVVKKGINIEYNRLGAYYVLGALTLVSHSASDAIPWLYDSVSYM
jgi:hypothetical protein